MARRKSAATMVEVEPADSKLRHGVEDLKANILVVDDDARNLFALEKMLEELGENIVAARSGEEALKRLLHEDFAVILLDVHMPGMDGYETAALIRKREKSRYIPIIFLTAINKDEVHMFRGYSAGAVDFVFKPVEPLILRSKISVFVELFKKAEEIRHQAEVAHRLQAENFRVQTEKMLAEQALQRSEERQALILRSLPIAVYSSDAKSGGPSSRYLSGNVESVTGYSSDGFEELGDSWDERIHPDDRQRALSDLSSIVDQGSATAEYRWYCPDGSLRTLLDHSVLIPKPDGSPNEIFGYLLDMSERRTLEQQLAHAQKMEAIGQLTGGIAHDFNNMLTVVIGNLDRLSGALPDYPQMQRRSQFALQGALRCADLTRRLLAFARRQPLEARPIDVAKLVHSMMSLLRRTLEDGIEVTLRAPEDLWPVLADSSQLEAAVLNLVINARDAMPDGGTVSVKLANAALSSASNAEALGLPPGDYVKLAVADSGIGMPPEIARRALEPFFTTKQSGKGTGLGLSITYGFVKQSGGAIQIESEAGQGTQVSVYLPRSTSAPVPLFEEPELPTVSRANTETILAVEDDHQVRHYVTMALRDLGYTVLEAENAVAALQALQHESKIDLLFTDIAMPGGMNGRELAVQAIRIRPDLKVLYTSAHPVTEDEIATGIPADLLRKPYRDADLAASVRRVLDSEFDGGRDATGAANQAR